jgi:hypothetical protein
MTSAGDAVLLFVAAAVFVVVVIAVGVLLAVRAGDRTNSDSPASGAPDD